MSNNSTSTYRAGKSRPAWMSPSREEVEAKREAKQAKAMAAAKASHEAKQARRARAAEGEANIKKAILAAAAAAVRPAVHAEIVDGLKRIALESVDHSKTPKHK